MQWGLDNEDSARNSFFEEMRKTDPNVSMELVGLHQSGKHPMTGCSGDGVVNYLFRFPRLWETKCPYSWRKFDPNLFATKLSQKQLKNIGLYHDDEGKIRLKKEHPHTIKFKCLSVF